MLFCSLFDSNLVLQFELIMLKLLILICCYFYFSKATYTRVGNKYMKIAETCCSLDPGRPSPRCDMTSLVATKSLQYALTPGHPGRFPIGKICMWSIQSQPDYQVRIEFQNFYLIGPDKNGDCTDQYVIVESPLTGHSMGRFCGNSGIPTIVSAGNLLIVRLFSEIPQSSEDFRGFTFGFRETLEAPNPEMRPGNWINHGQYSVSSKLIRQELAKLKPTNVPLHPVQSGSTMRTAIVSTSTKSKTYGAGRDENMNRKVKLKNPTPKIPSFAKPGILRENGQNIYGKNQPGDIIVTNNIQSKSNLPLSIEILVGIGVGAICITALLIVIICKISQVCSKRNEMPNPNAATPKNYANNGNPQFEMSNYGNRTLGNQVLNHNQLPVASSAEREYPESHSNQYLPEECYPYTNYSTIPYSQSAKSNDIKNSQGSTLSRSHSNSGIQPPPAHPYLNSLLTGSMLLYDTNTGMFLDPNAPYTNYIDPTLQDNMKNSTNVSAH